MLVDTHAHLQFPQYADRVEEYLQRARQAGVERVITIGVNGPDSARGVELAAGNDMVYATVGLHPHDAKAGLADLDQIRQLVAQPKVVAVGECGLDFYRNLSPAAEQENMLRAQVELAAAHNLPLVFHVRDAYDHFWRVVSDYSEVRGVVHSFSGSQADLEQCLKRGLLVAINGIVTFTQDPAQLAVFREVPLASLVLETDCPFLTPAPRRGQTNEPAEIKTIAAFLADLRQESYPELAAATSANARRLFNLNW